jgi:hypothetical protein
MIKLSDPTIDEVHCIRHLFDDTSQFKINMIEYDFKFRCPNPHDAKCFRIFLQRSWHFAYLRSKPVMINDIDTGYVGNPRRTKGKSGRVYVEPCNRTVTKLEYIVKRDWIRNNNIILLDDCFLVSPSRVIKNSSFRVFDFDAIAVRLKSLVPNNIASKILNKGNDILSKYGWYCVYRYFKRWIKNIDKVTLDTPFSD